MAVSGWLGCVSLCWADYGRNDCTNMSESKADCGKGLYNSKELLTGVLTTQLQQTLVAFLSIYVHMCTCTKRHTHTLLHMCTHTGTHIHTHTHKHTHTDTDTLMCPLKRKHTYWWVESTTIHLTITFRLFLMLYALDYENLNFVPVIFEKQDKGLLKIT